MTHDQAALTVAAISLLLGITNLILLVVTARIIGPRLDKLEGKNKRAGESPLP